MSTQSDFTVERYSSQREDEWEAFLLNSANGTIFHSHRFFAYHPPDRFQHHHLIFSLRGKIRSVFTGAEVETDKGLELRSHPGASYGGFALMKDADFSDYYGMVGALIEYGKDKGFKRLRLTQTPIIYYPDRSQGIEFALLAHGFQSEVVELTQSVNLQETGSDRFGYLVDKTRNACRQAIKKGLEYEENAPLTPANIAEFYEILIENRRKLGVTPTHTESELNRLAELIGDNLHLAFVEHRGERIAGLLHFICNPRVVLLFYVCHKREKQSLKPAPYLLARTIEWARNAGYEELDFGISTVKGEPTKGLLKFKENFRARPFLRTTYSLDLE